MYSADTENSSLIISNRIKLSFISFLLFSSLVHSDLDSSFSCYAEAAKSKHICLLHVTLLHIYYILILIV